MRLRVKRLDHEAEVSVVDHLDELRNRIFVCLISLAVGFVVAFWKHNEIAQLLIDLLPPGDQGVLEGGPLITGVGEQFKIAMSLSFWSAVLVALPVLFYQLYAYVVPAFNPGTQRSLWPLIYLVPPLFVAGVVFAYYLVLPRALDFLLTFDAEHYTVAPKASEFYTFCMLVMIVMGSMFQIPPVVWLLARMELIDSARMRKWRPYAILTGSIIAAVASPTVDPISMLIQMAPLVVLYEISIWLARLVERGRPIETEPADA